jgi:putative transposase
MDRRKDNAVEAILELLIETGPGDLAGLFARAFEPAMQIERERFLGAGHYQRTPERRGYANGTKPKRIDTPAGTVNVQVPKTAGHEGEPFYPQSLERGRRSVRAVMLAVAEMYIKGVSTRDVEAVMRVFGIESLSSSQVSRAAKLLDEELRPGATALSARSSISSSMRGMKKCAMAALCATLQCSRPSASVRMSAAAFSAYQWPCRRPRSTGGPFSKASSPAACAGSRSSSPTTTAACALPDDHSGLRAARRPQRLARCPARRSGRCHMATLPIPSGPQRHPPRPQRRDPQAHRQTAEIDLDGR